MKQDDDLTAILDFIDTGLAGTKYDVVANVGMWRGYRAKKVTAIDIDFTGWSDDEVLAP